MFKKRSSKVSHIRKPSEDQTSAESELEANEEVTNFEKINQFKQKQQEKQKLKAKYDFNELSQEDESNTKKKKLQKSEVTKSIENMIDSQFSVRKDEYNNSNNNTYNVHEKIMEKYIDEKLGLSTRYVFSYIILLCSTSYILLLYTHTYMYVYRRASSELTTEVSDKDNFTPKVEAEIGLLGVGSGLVEVELPSTYKQINIDATEKARVKLQEQKLLKQALYTSKLNSGSTIDYASFRYQKPALPHSTHIQHNTTHTNTYSTHTLTTTTSAAAPVVTLPTIPTVPTVAETEIIKGICLSISMYNVCIYEYIINVYMCNITNAYNLHVTNMHIHVYIL